MGLLFFLKIRTLLLQSKLWQSNCRRMLSKACFLFTGFCLFVVVRVSAQESLLDKRVSFPKQNTSLYNVLNLISQQADVLFIYDSKVVQNDKHVKVQAENLPLHKVLDLVLADPGLAYKVIGQHVLIYRIPVNVKPELKTKTLVKGIDSLQFITVKGYVIDNENKEKLPFASISILEGNIGTIANADGYFSLKVPQQYSGSSLVVSHLGFMSRKIPVQLLSDQKVDVFLDRRTISIQEVIIRYIDPQVIISKAMEQRKVNNNHTPAYITSFYREGVQKNDSYISYSEAVFKVYKSPYTHNENSDQVKLLKSRKIKNENPADTVFVKLKAGVLSALQLDIVKCVPGFLDQSEPVEYTYTYSDLVSYNSADAYAITFVQNKGIERALFAGTVYVEKDTYAILGADFEINPAYIDLAAEDLVLKKSRKLKVKFEKISYTISYKSFNGIYYLNHARCDIKLKTRYRNKLKSDNFSTFLELAACSIDTVNVVKYPRQEVLKPNVVFTDASYSNDDAFWGNYNIIAPEAKLNEALARIIGKLEEIE